MRRSILGAIGLTLLLSTPVLAGDVKYDLFPDLHTGLENVLPKFKAEHPDINVTYSKNETGDHHKKLTTELATGTGAGDLVAVDAGYLGSFINAGGFENLDAPEYNAQQFAKDFVPYAWQQAKGVDGKQYAFPLDIGPAVMYYRRDLLDQLGVKVEDVTKDWDSYIAFGRKAKEKGIYLIADASDVAGIIIRTTVKPGDGVFFDKDGKSLITSERFVKAFTLAKQIRDEGLDGQIQPWTNEWYSALNGGPMATQFSGAWLLGHMQNWMATDMAGKYGVSNLPDGIYGSQGGSFLAIPKQAANKKDAYELLKFMTANRQTQIDSLVKIGAFPANVTAYNAAELDQPIAYLGGQKANRLFADIAAKVPAVAPQKGDLVAQDAVFAGALAEVLNDGADLKESLANAEAAVMRRVNNQ